MEILGRISPVEKGVRLSGTSPQGYGKRFREQSGSPQLSCSKWDSPERFFQSVAFRPPSVSSKRTSSSANKEPSRDSSLSSFEPPSGIEVTSLATKCSLVAERPLTSKRPVETKRSLVAERPDDKKHPVAHPHRLAPENFSAPTHSPSIERQDFLTPTLVLRTPSSKRQFSSPTHSITESATPRLDPSMAPLQKQLGNIFGLLKKSTSAASVAPEDPSLSPVSSEEEDLRQDSTPSAYAALLNYLLL